MGSGGGAYKWQGYIKWKEMSEKEWCSAQTKCREGDNDLPLERVGPQVQVFAVLSEGGDYELLGTGSVEIVTDEDESVVAHCLQVRQGNDITLRSRLSPSVTYERQKGSVICWTDPHQPIYEDLAISFKGDAECDFYWRLLCERVGRDYMDISAEGRFELPNAHNLPQILDRCNKEKDAMHFYVKNSPAFFHALLSLLGSPPDTPHRLLVYNIITCMVECADLSTLTILFKDPAFDLLLATAQHKTGVDFPEAFSRGGRRATTIPLPQDIAWKVEVIHRATFYREHILDLASGGAVDSVLLMIIKDYFSHILLFLAKEDSLHLVLSLPLPIHAQLAFLRETFSVYRRVDSDKTRERFVIKFYHCGALSFLNSTLKLCLKHILKDDPKDPSSQLPTNEFLFPSPIDIFSVILQVLLMTAETNPQTFLLHLREDFREHPSQALIQRLAQAFCQPTGQQLTLDLVRRLQKSFKERKDLFDFFTGTFVCSVFERAKRFQPPLQLALVLLEQRLNLQNLYRQMTRHRMLLKIAQELPKVQSKWLQLATIKLLKALLLEDILSQSPSSLKQQVVSSGFFDACLQILARNLSMYGRYAGKRDNLIISTMLGTLQLIERLPTSPYHLHLLDNYSFDQTLAPVLAAILTLPMEVATKITMPVEASHQRLLQNQLTESYFLQENQDHNVFVQQEKKEERCPVFQKLQQHQDKVQTGKRERPMDFVLDFIFDQDVL